MKKKMVAGGRVSHWWIAMVLFCFLLMAKCWRSCEIQPYLHSVGICRDFEILKEWKTILQHCAVSLTKSLCLPWIWSAFLGWHYECLFHVSSFENEPNCKLNTNVFVICLFLFHFPPSFSFFDATDENERHIRWMPSGHPPGKKSVNANQHGRVALLKSRTVGSSHELNANHDGGSNKCSEGAIVASSGTGTVAGHCHASPPPPLRSKVKTNGHLIPYMQQQHNPYQEQQPQQQQQVAYHSVKSRGSFSCFSTELLIKITS